jgi:uncharacterized membrane protein
MRIREERSPLQEQRPETTVTVPVFADASPRVRRIAAGRPWQWLAQGWEDLRRSPGVSLQWGLLCVLAGYALLAALLWFNLFVMVLPIVAGFVLVAPILGVGLYEVSRRREAGEPPVNSAPASARAALRRSGARIGFMGFILGFFFLAWMRIATLLYALFFGTEPVVMSEFLHRIVLSNTNLAFLAVGTAIGAVLALSVFAVAAVSIPMLLDRDVNVVVAVVTSVEAVRQNPLPMLLWAALIVLFTGAGILCGLVGLAITHPLVAYATWHAYRDLVVAP